MLRLESPRTTLKCWMPRSKSLEKTRTVLVDLFLENEQKENDVLADVIQIEAVSIDIRLNYFQ